MGATLLWYSRWFFVHSKLGKCAWVQHYIWAVLYVQCMLHITKQNLNHLHVKFSKHYLLCTAKGLEYCSYTVALDQENWFVQGIHLKNYKCLYVIVDIMEVNTVGTTYTVYVDTQIICYGLAYVYCMVLQAHILLRLQKLPQPRFSTLHEQVNKMVHLHIYM